MIPLLITRVFVVLFRHRPLSGVVTQVVGGVGEGGGTCPERKELEVGLVQRVSPRGGRTGNDCRYGETECVFGLKVRTSERRNSGVKSIKKIDPKCCASSSQSARCGRDEGAGEAPERGRRGVALVLTTSGWREGRSDSVEKTEVFRRLYKMFDFVVKLRGTIAVNR